MRVPKPKRRYVKLREKTYTQTQAVKHWITHQKSGSVSEISKMVEKESKTKPGKKYYFISLYRNKSMLDNRTFYERSEMVCNSFTSSIGVRLLSEISTCEYWICMLSKWILFQFLQLTFKFCFGGKRVLWQISFHKNCVTPQTVNKIDTYEIGAKISINGCELKRLFRNRTDASFYFIPFYWYIQFSVVLLNSNLIDEKIHRKREKKKQLLCETCLDFHPPPKMRYSDLIVELIWTDSAFGAYISHTHTWTCNSLVCTMYL